MMHYLITVAAFVLTEFKALDFLYHFQVKEYRLDRFMAMIKDKELGQVFFAISKLPARTMRNLLAAVIITCLLIFWSAVSFTDNLLLAATVIGYPLVALAAASTGVILTWLPSAIRRQILMAAARAKLRRLKITVIGITGSFGKTTTKEYLFDILSQKYVTAKTIHNMNTETGVALSALQEVNTQTQFFIAEMGAYKPGEIKEICRMVSPRYAILTAIGNQHLDLFGSRERLLSAKKELLLSLPPQGKAYINASRAPLDKLKTGLKASVIPYRAPDKSVNLNAFNLPPAVIRENLVPCILLARELGLSENEIRAGILAIKGKRQRLTPRTGKNGVTIIDNSYNTNREGCIFSIGILNERKEKTKILVTPGIIELGGEKDLTYKEILHVLTKTDVALYTTDADFGKGSIKNVRVFENETVMRDAMLTKLNQETVILFEGRINRGFINSLLEK